MGEMRPFSNELVELIKDRQILIQKYPHLKVLHYQIHQIEETAELDQVQKALDINLLLVSHLHPEIHPEVDQFLKKYKSQYFLNLDRQRPSKALYPSMPAPEVKKTGF